MLKPLLLWFQDINKASLQQASSQILISMGNKMVTSEILNF